MSTHAVIPKNTAAFTPARRTNQALTASLEKRALQWMAHRAPRWLTSDQLTLLGFTAQIGAGIFYALSRYNRNALLLVILCLILNWFGDSMDGTLARVRSQQRHATASTSITWSTSSAQSPSCPASPSPA
jgi:archaetidylinositol phosphate synthase